MLKIGDFSKLSQISIRMLRHYDDLGLLPPASTDPFTGYRYYSEEQLLTANRIQSLKDMGFPLAEIRSLLSFYDTPQQLLPYLLQQKERLRQEANALHQKQYLLENAMNRIRKDEWNMKYTVTQKTLPARFVASIRQIIPTYAHEGTLWHFMMKETIPLHLPAVPSSGCMAIFHDEAFVEQNPDVEIQMIVDKLYPPTEHISFKELPPLEYASATYQGGYEKISEVNEAIATWMQTNGYAFAGHSFNIYHIGPHDTQNPEEWVTEVCCPIRKRG